MCKVSLNMIFSFVLLATFITFNTEAKPGHTAYFDEKSFCTEINTFGETSKNNRAWFIHSDEKSSIDAIQNFIVSVNRFQTELSSANKRPDFKNNPRIAESLDAVNELNSKYVKAGKLINEYVGGYLDYSKMPQQWEALQKEIDDVLGSRIKAQTALYQTQGVMPEDVQERMINVLEESSVEFIQALQEIQIGLNRDLQNYENNMKG